jgi:hypothetical protein
VVRGPQFDKRWYSLLPLGYKPLQHVTVLNTVGNCNIMVSIIMAYCNTVRLESRCASIKGVGFVFHELY